MRGDAVLPAFVRATAAAAARAWQRAGALVAVAAFAAAAATSGCSQDESFVLVTLVSADARTFTDVGKVRVVVDNAGQADTLVYPRDGSPFTIGDAQHAQTFSVSFGGSRSGTLDVSAFPLDASGTVIGWARGSIAIDKDHVARLTLAVNHGAPPADGGADANPDGAGPDGRDGGATETGPEAAVTCDPARPTACQSGQTCTVSCPRATGQCVLGGTRSVGATCAGDFDCASGTGCFVFKDLAGARECGRACVAFCKDDGDCSGASCSTPVSCGGPVVADTCSFACDPRPDVGGTAAKGCPAGLLCGIFKNELVDCVCPEATRTGGDGATCKDSNDCKAGFQCVQMGSGTVCRQICRLGDGKDCPGGKTCQMLSSYHVFGACF